MSKAKAKRKPERRDEALSRERIVKVAIELLDDDGESGLTFRALAMRLATGSGAIYWHIKDKDELLVAATDAVVADAMAELVTRATPHEAIRELAVAVFEAVDAHPWVGAQLSHAPWGTATLELFEHIGRQVQVLGARGSALFTSASTLGNYIIGVSTQNAANARALKVQVDRAEFLQREASRWNELDTERYAFLRSVAPQLAKHDDRAEFLAGIDVIVAGILASRPC
jgi:AcrR family transcriptional regulator